MNIKNEVFNFLKNQIIKPCCKDKNDYMVMIVDDEMLEIISSVCSIMNLNQSGIGVVLNLSYERDVMNLPAIYLLKPSLKNIDTLLDDFNTKKSLYSEIHLFVNGHIKKNLMQKMQKRKSFVKKIQTFKEVDLDFLIFGKNVLNLNMNSSVPMLYKDIEPDHNFLKKIAGSLASFCISINEFPLIRFIKMKNNCEFAKMFEDQINSKIRKLENWKYKDNRSTLVILDRSFDPVAPVMHEYTFKAMAADLLEIKGEFVNINNEKKLMMANDKIWEKFGDEHIAIVIKEIPKMSKKFISSHPLTNGNKEILKNAGNMLKKAPEYRKETESFAKNIDIAEACMDIYKRENHKILSDFEQDIATKMDSSGNKMKLSKIEKKIKEISLDNNITLHQKLRILIIYILSISEVDDKLVHECSKNANFKEEQKKALKNLSLLKNKEILSDNLDYDYLTPNKKNLSLIRFSPKLKKLLEDICCDKLQNETLPYMREQPPPSDEKDKLSSRRARRKKGKNEARLIIFILGGATYSEIRSVNELMKKYEREIILGSTHILTPKNYLKQLSIM